MIGSIEVGKYGFRAFADWENGMVLHREWTFFYMILQKFTETWYFKKTFLAIIGHRSKVRKKRMTAKKKSNSSITQNNRRAPERCPGRRKKIPVLPYLLILPAMLLFIVFNYYPFFKAVFLSFTLTDKTGHFAKWVGLSNWIRILGKRSFWQVIWITIKMAGINLIFTYLIALLFALLAMKKTRFSKIYQTMYALPMAIASSPAAAIFLFIYRQKNGLLNELLGGAEIGWTTQMPYALWAVCAMTIWMHVGVSFIFLLVGFRNVSEEVLESARLDGAGPLQRVRYILLPMSSSQLFFVLFLNISSSFRCFAQIKLLTNGGPANGTKNLIYYIYENAIINGRFETACVQAMFLFLLILILTGVQFALEKKTVFYQ